MRIGSFDTASRVLVVAEIGNNHEGDFAVATRLIDLAAGCGADAVKFQTARAELFINPSDTDRRARFQSYEFTPEQWASLSHQAHERGLLFLSTPLDLKSVELLAPLVDAFKVASGDITFGPLLDAVATTCKPVILSTGAAELDEIVTAVERVRSAWARRHHDGQLGVLHCVSAYPTPPDEARLRTIEILQRTLDATIGYSDHVLGVEAAVAAVALGARIVEKHFTLDKAHSAFRDHQLSADPDDMSALVRRIRALEPMLGDVAKEVQRSEAPNTAAIRRSVAAAADLPAGRVLAAGDFVWMRPGTGLAPGEEQRLIGRTLARAVRFGELLSDADVT